MHISRPITQGKRAFSLAPSADFILPVFDVANFVPCSIQGVLSYGSYLTGTPVTVERVASELTVGRYLDDTGATNNSEVTVESEVGVDPVTAVWQYGGIVGFPETLIGIEIENGSAVNAQEIVLTFALAVFTNFEDTSTLIPA